MEEYNLAENPDVLFGHADSLYAQYRWADCFAITSRYERSFWLLLTTS
jgi:anaphase-promoting complex subunit 6